MYADNVSSIEAVLSLGTHAVYTTDNIESLRSFLTVTAHYTDETSEVVTEYELEGDISTAGTCEVTVKYGRSKRTTVSVTVESNPTGILYEWDFTRGPEGLTDLRQGAKAALKFNSNVTTLPNIDENGVTLINAQCIELFNARTQVGDIIVGKTIQVDVASFTSKQTSLHNRFILIGDDNYQYGTQGSVAWCDGLIYNKDNAVWKIYNGQAWSSAGFSGMSSRNIISGKKVAMYVNSSGTCKVYLDGTSKGTVSGANLRKTHLYGLRIGATDTSGAFYDAVITGVRIYNGEVGS